MVSMDAVFPRDPSSSTFFIVCKFGPSYLKSKHFEEELISADPYCRPWSNHVLTTFQMAKVLKISSARVEIHVFLED